MRTSLQRQIFPLIIPMALCWACLSCNQNPGSTHPGYKDQGGLFIIGGGTRSPEMVCDILSLATTDTTDVIYVFPHASAEPDTAFYYASRQFEEHGYRNVCNAFMESGKEATASMLDSIRHSSLIYLTGGDQSRFMELVGESTLKDALEEAYERGAVIAGTSAGAAVMSRKMITGDQYKYPEYTGYFRTIEANNMELADGLGFLSSAVIDQHFIRRMRLNRLLSVVLENPELTGIGIDESTALFVRGHMAKVYGESQVIVVRHPGHASIRHLELLGVKDLRIDILVPGDTITLHKIN
jgi:cyanophycinase